MTSGQKVTLSLLLSIIVFSAFTVLAFSGLFNLVEVNFYQPFVEQTKEQKIEEIAAAQKEYFSTLMNRFNAFTLNADVKTYADLRPSDEATQNREKRRSELITTTSALLGIRIVDTNGQNVYFSTFYSDVIKNKNGSVSYKNFPVVSDISYDSVKSSDWIVQNQNADEKCRIIKDSKGNRLIFSLPFFDSQDYFKGTALFYCDAGNFSRFLYNRNLIDVNGFGVLVAEKMEEDGTLSGFGGFVFGLPNLGRTDAELQILKKWKESPNEKFWKIIPETDSAEVLDSPNASIGEVSGENDEDSSRPFCVFSRKGERSDFGYISLIFEDSELKLSIYLRILLLSAAFVTFYLILFLILSFRHDDIVVIKDRLKKYKNEFLLEYRKVENVEELSDLKNHKKSLKRQVTASLGKIAEKHASEFDDLFEKTWSEILITIGKKAAPLLTDNIVVNKNELRSILEDILGSGSLKVQVAQISQNVSVPAAALSETLPRSSSVSETGGTVFEKKNADSVVEQTVEDITDKASETGASMFENTASSEIENSDDVESIEEIEEIEEISEAEELDEVEEISDAEESDDADELNDELDEIEAEAELSDVEEVTEVEDAAPVDDLDSLEELEADEEIEEAESADEIPLAEDVDKAGQADDVEDIEEIEDAESVEEVEEAESVEEIDDVELVEEVEDAEPVEDTESVDEAEDSEEIEELEDVETFEDIEDVDAAEEDAAPVDDLDSLEELEADEEIEEAEPADEIPLAEDVDKAGQADDVEDIEELEDVESVEEVEEAEPVEDTESVDEAEEIEELEDVDTSNQNVDSDTFVPGINDNNIESDDEIYEDEQFLEKIDFGVPEEPETMVLEEDAAIRDFAVVQPDFKYLDLEDGGFYDDNLMDTIEENEKNRKVANARDFTKADDDAEENPFGKKYELIVEEKEEFSESQKLESAVNSENEAMTDTEISESPSETALNEPEMVEPAKIIEEKTETDTVEPVEIDSEEEKTQKAKEPGTEEISELESLEEPEETMPFTFTKIADDKSNVAELLSEIPDAIVENSDGTFSIIKTDDFIPNQNIDLEFKKLVDSILK